MQRGFAVFLDDRQLTTPAKALLGVPTETLAAEIAQEWLDQTGNVKPVQFDAVVDMVAEYGGSDLICYRADTPAGLVARQAAAWDPLVDWAETELDAPLNVTTGILPVAQPERSLERMRNTVADRDPFRLAALHDLVTLSGSLVLGLAVAANHLGPEEAWNVSRIDENWQAELWGTDEEAHEAALIKENQFKFACRFLKLLQS